MSNVFTAEYAKTMSSVAIRFFLPVHSISSEERTILSTELASRENKETKK
jgi:hypothetical protein